MKPLKTTKNDSFFGKQIMILQEENRQYKKSKLRFDVFLTGFYR